MYMGPRVAHIRVSAHACLPEAPAPKKKNEATAATS